MTEVQLKAQTILDGSIPVTDNQITDPNNIRSKDFDIDFDLSATGISDITGISGADISSLLQ